MAEQPASSGAAGRVGGRRPPAPPAAQRGEAPGRIRNVVLVGHTGAGKTTLVEAMLAATGTVPRAGRVEDGTAVSDHDEAELRQHRSVSLALAPLRHRGVKVNLLDTPGHADFVGDLRAGLRAADAALFVVSAVDGLDAPTRMLWDECAVVAMPRAVVVTGLDRARADFEETVAVCQRVLAPDNPASILPLQLPVAAEDGSIAGVMQLLAPQIVDYSGGARTERAPDAEHLPLIAGHRDALIEGIIAESEDETLMDRYLAGGDLDVAVLTRDLERAVARGAFHPVLPSAPPHGVGVREVLDLVTGAFPSPAEHELPAVTAPDGSPRAPLQCDPAGPLLAEVVKTTSDPYAGRLSLVRVFSGTLRPDAPVHVSGHGGAAVRGAAPVGHPDHDVDDRTGALSSPLGGLVRPVEACGAGDICTVAGLARAETGDTLSDPARPLLIEPWVLPEPVLPVAVLARSSADQDRLAHGLSRLVAEDPTLRLERDAGTGRLVLWCLGEAHVDVLLSRLRGRYGVAADASPLRVPLRETFGGPARGHGRHVARSGGRGQFAVCDIEVEPLPTGGGFEFVDRVVGGAVPQQFVPAVETGLRAQLLRGVAAGYPLVDVRVTLVDGRAHPVDSSDSAFQTAAALALRDAARRADVRLLEPVDAIAVDLDDEYVAAVRSDLSSRRGRVSGSTAVGSGRTRVEAAVPAAELTRYAVDLRALAHGTATFTRSYLRHQPLPARLAAPLLAAGAAQP